MRQHRGFLWVGLAFLSLGGLATAGRLTVGGPEAALLVSVGLLGVGALLVG